MRTGDDTGCCVDELICCVGDDQSLCEHNKQWSRMTKSIQLNANRNSNAITANQVAGSSLANAGASVFALSTMNLIPSSSLGFTADGRLVLPVTLTLFHRISEQLTCL